MPRYKFTVAYDGSSFSGWQIQKGASSIQEEVEKALAGLSGTSLRIHGSGRTDAGVHALGQVFHADIPDTLNITEDNWPRALNTKLPSSIRILSARLVPDDFHARFSATGKTYEYRLVTNRILMPFDFQRVGHYPQPLDGDTFQEAVRLFSGTHDFRPFAAIRGNEPDPLPKDYYIRTITTAEAIPMDSGFLIRFTGTGFLYKMVRLMVGSAHAAAVGKTTLDYLRRQIDGPQAPKGRYCASPCGLTLRVVYYE